MNLKRQHNFLRFIVSTTPLNPSEIPFIGDKISGSPLQIPPLKVFNLSVSSKSCIIPPLFLSIHPLLSFFLPSFFLPCLSPSVSFLFLAFSPLSPSLSLSLARIPLHKGPHCIVLIQRQHSFRDMQG